LSLHVAAECLPIFLAAEVRAEITRRERLKRPIRTFGGCPAARLVLETRIQEYGNGLDERPNMSLRKKAPKKTGRNVEIIIPDKLYFRIGEVAGLCRLPAYVLRFWETEFPQLKPVKSSTGQRMYRKRDVESVVRIKKLLYEDGFTIAGARLQLREETKSERNQTALPFPMNPATSVAHLRHELQQILHILSARH
jgi:DNA-binding transcriptional MerR regulator